MTNKILIKCKEAVAICDKSQYNEASIIDKIRLSMHNFLCKKCKLYSQKNKFMTKLFKVNLNKTKKSQCLCSSEKEKMEKELQKEINK